MMINANRKRIVTSALATLAFVLLSGGLYEVSAQCSGDPFCIPPYERKASPSTGAESDKPKKPKGPQIVEAPPIEARIEYYKRMREQAAVAGRAIPKVTSVLLLDEMAVTGIFKTPRGYAAMVEATPIKLSYTIYPGERFFDGQLVAVEEHQLVFRKVTKWSNNKFVSSVENKSLRNYSMEQTVQGTVPPVGPYSRRTETASASGSEDKDGESPGEIVSPLEEMKNQPAESEKPAKSAKKAPAKRKGN